MPAGASLPGALALAERLAALPPLAVAVAKEVIDARPTASDEAALVLERLAYAMLGQTREHGEATHRVHRGAGRRGAGAGPNASTPSSPRLPTSLPMISRWISDVPSQIRSTRMSR